MIRLPKFCPHCGGPLHLQLHDGRERPVCSACGHIVYLNPAPSVAAILYQEGRVLLVRRVIQPGYGLWSLPGGFIEAGETPEAAVIREVEEETGLSCQPLRLLNAQGVSSGYYGDILVLCYSAEATSGTLRAGFDADDARYFDLRELPEIAFDVHRSFISQFLYEYHGIALE
jgi:NADH pyrophosphatase NudC (nudix superfamily)